MPITNRPFITAQGQAVPQKVASISNSNAFLSLDQFMFKNQSSYVENTRLHHMGVLIIGSVCPSVCATVSASINPLYPATDIGARFCYVYTGQPVARNKFHKLAHVT